MIVLARVVLLSAVIFMSGIMALYYVTAPANLAWLNGAQ